MQMKIKHKLTSTPEADFFRGKSQLTMLGLKFDVIKIFLQKYILPTQIIEYK